MGFYLKQKNKKSNGQLYIIKVSMNSTIFHPKKYVGRTVSNNLFKSNLHIFRKYWTFTLNNYEDHKNVTLKIWLPHFNLFSMTSVYIISASYV